MRPVFQPNHVQARTQQQSPARRRRGLFRDRKRGERLVETEIGDLELGKNGVQQLAGGAGVRARFGEVAEVVAEQQLLEVDEEGAGLVAVLAILRDHALFVVSFARESDGVGAAAHEVQHALPEDFVVVVVRLLLELAVHGAVGAGFLFHALQRPAAQERVDAVDVRVHAGELDQAGFEPDLEGFLQRTQTPAHMLGPVILVGLLPTYDKIGIAAPVLLVLLRMFQGIGLGGEWGGAVLMVVENAPARSRGLLGSMVQIGYPIGNLAAIGMFALLSRVSESDFFVWGWRIPFLISIVLVGVGLYIRLQLKETPVFRDIEAKKQVARVPLVEILTRHRRPFFTAVGLKLSEISYATIGTVFAISYITGKLAMPRSVIINAILLSAVVAFVAIPLFGWLSDKIGRKTMFYASCLFAMGFAFPMFWLLDTKAPLTITLTIIAAITFGQMVGFGVGAPWYSELFTARLRYSGASLGFQIGAAISGGLTPFAAATFMAWTGGATWPISVYLIVLALITIVATLAAPETAGKPLK